MCIVKQKIENKQNLFKKYKKCFDGNIEDRIFLPNR